MLSRGLYLVATPIGNAADITLRALEILRAADIVACEDTRTTKPFLQRHGLLQPGSTTRLTAYHDHNAPRVRPGLLAAMRGGGAVALVSDAGTPAISDPGFKLVRECIDAGIPVTAAPGPTSIVVALTLSGLPTDRFFFAGFLPNKSGARQRDIETLRAIPGTLIFMESPRRLAACLADLLKHLGDRPAAVARELTKLYEEVRRGTLSELVAHYDTAGAPKGEVVITVGPAAAEAAPDLASMEADILARLEGESARDIARDLANQTGLPRREVYGRVLEMTKRRDQGG